MQKIKVGRNHFALVDDEDVLKVKNYYWSYHIGYARDVKKNILMHRLIMNCKPEEKIDHINRNRLDNRKENLRICSQADNVRNHPAKLTSKRTSKYKGVCFQNKPRLKNKWIAQITFNYKTEHIGSFPDEISAARAYDEYAKKYFGEFAVLNFP